MFLISQKRRKIDQNMINCLQQTPPLSLSLNLPTTRTIHGSQAQMFTQCVRRLRRYNLKREKWREKERDSWRIRRLYTFRTCSGGWGKDKIRWQLNVVGLNTLWVQGVVQCFGQVKHILFPPFFFYPLKLIRKELIFGINLLTSVDR